MTEKARAKLAHETQVRTPKCLHLTRSCLSDVCLVILEMRSNLSCAPFARENESEDARGAGCKGQDTCETTEAASTGGEGEEGERASDTPVNGKH